MDAGCWYDGLLQCGSEDMNAMDSGNSERNRRAYSSRLEAGRAARDQKPHRCPECGRGFRNPVAMRLHARDEHGMVVTVPLMYEWLRE